MTTISPTTDTIVLSPDTDFAALALSMIRTLSADEYDVTKFEVGRYINDNENKMPDGSPTRYKIITVDSTGVGMVRLSRFVECSIPWCSGHEYCDVNMSDGWKDFSHSQEIISVRCGTERIQLHRELWDGADTLFIQFSSGMTEVKPERAGVAAKALRDTADQIEAFAREIASEVIAQ